MNANSLTITDNRTGKQYEVAIENDTIKAMDLRQIKTSEEDFGLMTYDPAFTNTASCKSRITLIDGDLGILRYRGYPIEQLAERSNYLETAYLILHGELPTEAQLKDSVAFFTSESGKKYVSSQPDMLNKLVTSMQAWQRVLSTDMIERLRFEFKKKNIEF